jgi:hypothetical protein
MVVTDKFEMLDLWRSEGHKRILRCCWVRETAVVAYKLPTLPTSLHLTAVNAEVPNRISALANSVTCFDTSNVCNLLAVTVLEWRRRALP